MSNNDIIAVHGDAIEQAGTITWWRLRGDTDADLLTQAWTDEGLDPEGLPMLPSDVVACRRAVQELRGPQRIVRPLHRSDTPRGWAIVDETTKTTLHFTPALHVLLNKIGVLEFELPDGTKISPDDHPAGTNFPCDTARAVAAAYSRHLHSLSSNDVSVWLVRSVRRLDALGLKDTSGGLYFVARPFVHHWERIAKCVRKGTPHEVLLMPAMRTDEAVESILSSLQAEAEAEAQSMFDEIAAGELGGRALATRADRCAALQRKVAQYEKLCGRAVPLLGERLTELAGSLLAARMAADAAADEESA